MRKETDLPKVKMIAHVLLDMPIAETSFSPATNAWLALDEYGEEDFLSVDIENSWVALAFNTWGEKGNAHQYLPINPQYEESQENAPVEIGGQTPVRKRNALDNLNLAAECVLHFAQTGELYPLSLIHI